MDTPLPTALEQSQMRRSTAFVVVTSLVQFFFGILLFLSGGFLFAIITILFASIGIIGCHKRHYKMLTAHFVYSLGLYILTLIVNILLIFEGTNFIVNVIGLGIMIFEAIGLRHSRIMITMAKKYGPRKSCCQRTQQVQQVEVELQEPLVQQPQVQYVPVFIPVSQEEYMNIMAQQQQFQVQQQQ